MITTIFKRDGRAVPFNLEKIANAIFKAARTVGGNDYDEALKLSYKVCQYIEEVLRTQNPTVEQVQDAVERILVESGHTKTAKAYILYRAERTRVRDMNSKLMKTFEDLTFKAADEIDLKRENANIDGDTSMGTMLKYGSESSKQFYEMFVIDKKQAEAHKSGDIHIHDMDFYALTTTCTQIDLIKLFKDGFCTGHGFIREPNDISSYSALACIAIQSNQNDQHGGQSIPNFDYSMSYGVKKTYIKHYKNNLGKGLELLCSIDDGINIAKVLVTSVIDESGVSPLLDNSNNYQQLEYPALLDIVKDEALVKQLQKFVLKESVRETDRSTFQAMEALIHNLNTMHSRAGAQIPFSSLNYGTDTSPEGRLVIKNLLLAEKNGLGNGETPIFPIHIFKVKEGVNYNKEDPNYDLFKLACEVSAKRLFPNFSFLDAPFNKQFYKEGDYNSEVSYMGCRTRVMSNNYDKSQEVTCGRGNLSFTSVNLPRLGIIANGNLDIFFNMLEEKMELVYNQLLDRFKIQGDRRVKNYPFLMGQGIWLGSDKLSLDDKVAEVLKHGTLTIGFIGLAETLVALIGEHHGQSEKARELGLKIIKFMRDFTDKKSEETGLNFSLIATPAEGLSGRFVKLDKERFGVIKGVTDRDYYTNSFHIPVYFPISAFDKIRYEAPYHALTNGGHISYVELDGDPLQNLEAFEQIIRFMKESGIGYGSINHPVDRDPVCGYTGIIGNTCPRCGRSEAPNTPKFQRIRRITGYLVGTVDRFNNAKRAEEKDRVKHNI